MDTSVSVAGRRRGKGRLAGLAATGIMAVVAMTALAAPAAAAGVEREARGACSGTSRWKLELDKEHGFIEVDLDIDTTVSGRKWKVRMWHNERRFVKTVRTTDHEGEIDLDRVRTDRSGTDTFRFRTIDKVNGEVCEGQLSI